MARTDGDGSNLPKVRRYSAEKENDVKRNFPDNQLGEPIKSFDDTFSAQTLMQDVFFQGEEARKAAAALQGLPYAAVPLDQLADIYKRFLRLTRLGQASIPEWCAMPKAEADVRHAVFDQADFGAVFSGQWLPQELRQEIRDLVKGKRYDHNFDQHEVAYHRNKMDLMIQR